MISVHNFLVKERASLHGCLYSEVAFIFDDTLIWVSVAYSGFLGEFYPISGGIR